MITTTTRFRAWLRRQWERDDPTGRLALRFRHDWLCPKLKNSLTDWEDHLRRNDADEAEIEALHNAWREYEARKELFTFAKTPLDCGRQHGIYG
jgi:hypothetical protein